MTLEEINKLPRYIEAPSGGMWGPMPAGFSISNEDAIFVKLTDVRGLLRSESVVVTEKIIRQDGEDFIYVGRGGKFLADLALSNDWLLYSYATKKSTRLSPLWSGSDSEWEYYIKKVAATCPGCKNEIDPDVCHCGSDIKSHGVHDGHNPVPRGCTCGYQK